MKNVVAYCRVSTDAQAGEDKFGIETQKGLIEGYCAAHGMYVTEWYIDEGESGAKERRPELDRLLFGEIKNPPVEAVIVAKSDRIARDIKLYFYYMMLLGKKKIELISATEEVVNDDTGLGNVYKALMMFVAEQERANITKRTAGGRKVKAAAGGYSGGRAPFGYEIVKGKGYVIVPEEAAIVRLIFGLRESGKTLKEISEYLTKRMYYTKQGRPFAISVVKGILDNRRTYEGEYHYGKGSEWVKGQHEAILKREEPEDPEKRKKGAHVKGILDERVYRYGRGKVFGETVVITEYDDIVYIFGWKDRYDSYAVAKRESLYELWKEAEDGPIRVSEELMARIYRLQDSKDYPSSEEISVLKEKIRIKVRDEYERQQSEEY